jgi:hypothetical protein
MWAMIEKLRIRERSMPARSDQPALTVCIRRLLRRAA